MTAHRIALADDHALVRQGLRMILQAEPDLVVAAEACDGMDAIDAAAGVDLAIFDVSMPRLTGFQAARELSRRAPDVPVLILSMHANEQYLCEAARAGAAGYVLKAAVDRELVGACRAVLAGERFVFPSGLDPDVRERITAASAGEPGERDHLSSRELEVLRLIADGRSGREIGEELFISEKTVDRHRANIFAKLGLRDRVELTRYAIRCGLIEA